MMVRMISMATILLGLVLQFMLLTGAFFEQMREVIKTNHFGIPSVDKARLVLSRMEGRVLTCLSKPMSGTSVLGRMQRNVRALDGGTCMSPFASHIELDWIY